MTDNPKSAKLVLLLSIPAILMTAIITISLALSYEQILSDQHRDYGQATSEQLSDQFAAYLVADDILSINVLAKKFAETDYIAFLAIYDDNNTLMAQSGKESGGSDSFTHEITFQDSLVGFVRVTPAEKQQVSPLLYLLWLVSFALSVLFAYWISPYVLRDGHARNGSEYPDDEFEIEEPVPEPTGPTEECILVVRIRPARYLEHHFDKFFKAAGLYNGIVEQTTTEELVIHFEGGDALYEATLTGRLMQQLALKAGGNISFGGTLNLLEEEPEKIRKSASYLASIAEGELLLAGTSVSIRDRVELQTFHHSLVDSSDVKKITAIDEQSVLDSQVDELVAG